MPEGFYITFPMALGVGLGLVMCTLLLSITIMVFLEFPIFRLLQLLFLRFISHDELLRDWHERQGNEQAQLKEENIRKAQRDT